MLYRAMLYRAIELIFVPDTHKENPQSAYKKISKYNK